MRVKVIHEKINHLSPVFSEIWGVKRSILWGWIKWTSKKIVTYKYPVKYHGDIFLGTDEDLPLRSQWLDKYGNVWVAVEKNLVRNAQTRMDAYSKPEHLSFHCNTFLEQ